MVKYRKNEKWNIKRFTFSPFEIYRAKDEIESILNEKYSNKNIDIMDMQYLQYDNLIDIFVIFAILK